MTPNPIVQSFFHADSGTWSHVVRDPASPSAAIIDPVLDYDISSARTGSTSAQALIDHVDAHSLRVDWLLETHAHADHLSAAHWLQRERLPRARIGIGRGITGVQATFRGIYGLDARFSADGSQFDQLFDDGDVFAIGNLQARVIGVPGHTGDSNAFQVGDAVFVGDSLFMPDGGTARCDFPGGDAATLFASIQRLYALPDATRVFVCHDYAPGGRAPACQTTIGAQKQDNIHVRADTTEAGFVALRQARDAALPPPTLLLPALQVNIRAGELPAPDANGRRYLRIPLDTF